MRYPVRKFVQELIHAEKEGNLPDDLLDAMQKILAVTLELRRSIDRLESDADLDHAKRSAN
jgi:hypothetical protein